MCMRALGFNINLTYFMDSWPRELTHTEFLFLAIFECIFNNWDNLELCEMIIYHILVNATTNCKRDGDY